MYQHLTNAKRWIVTVVLFTLLLSAGASAMNSVGNGKNLQRSEIPGQPLPPPPPPPPASR